MTKYVYRVHATDGDDLGLLEHPAPNVEPGDVVVLADGREALVKGSATRIHHHPLPDRRVGVWLFGNDA